MINQTHEEARALLNIAEASGGINWTFDNEDGLVWGIPDPVTPVPTQEEIDAEIVRFTAEDKDNLYKEKRRSEYPSIEECVHAMLDGDLDELQAKRQAVKARFPK